jgi:hypothetical protein
MEEMAKEWAVSDEHDGYANRYELEMDGLEVLDLDRGYTVLTWLAVLLQNRTFNVDSPLGREAAAYLKKAFWIDTQVYDIICGYRADDSYFLLRRISSAGRSPTSSSNMPCSWESSAGRSFWSAERRFLN